MLLCFEEALTQSILDSVEGWLADVRLLDVVGLGLNVGEGVEGKVEGRGLYDGARFLWN
jgi:hypothetical protein